MDSPGKKSPTVWLGAECKKSHLFTERRRTEGPSYFGEKAIQGIGSEKKGDLPLEECPRRKKLICEKVRDGLRSATYLALLLLAFSRSLCLRNMLLTVFWFIL